MKRYPLGMPAWLFWILTVITASLLGSIPAAGPWLIWIVIVAAFVYFFALVKPEPNRRSSSTAGQELPPPGAVTLGAPAPAAPIAADMHAPTSATSKRSPRQRKARPQMSYELMGSDGWPSVEVAGEFARIDALWRAIGRRPRVDEEIELESVAAELLPEPTNKYDSNAVMVLINGEHVGYLERENAADYHEPLAQLVAAGVAPVTRARVWTTQRETWDTGKVKGHARITLALNPPGMLAPTNNPPESPYSLLPWGRAVQVSGEENHLDVIGEYLASSESLAIGTLVEERTTPARAEPKAYVEVRIDGEQVGQMTPSMSENFLPTIRHLADQGQATAAWLKVKGSLIAAQITVHAEKAHELSDDWFERPSTTPPLHPRRAQPATTDAAEDVEDVRVNAREEPMWGED
ncbi:HIRAN domain-containing protein [Microbacterium karelineae]|uniref:HIRAN domain-containing protein n=1 Tax=Microbacterium karelineae TaxID=2654283 RepID=UPI0012EA8B1B|nr:HIRAN domain-containing protein [Microbacterium karelineae]